MANSGKKTLTNLFHPWKVYMQTRQWPIDCPEMNTPFIECQNTLRFALEAQVEMILKKDNASLTWMVLQGNLCVSKDGNFTKMHVLQQVGGVYWTGLL